MNSNEREPSRDQERRERESFVVLQHAYTLSDADPSASLPYARLGEDLGFAEPHFGDLVAHLVGVGYLARVGAGSLLSITPAGIDYIERLAWRRRSVRTAPQRPLPFPEG